MGAQNGGEDARLAGEAARVAGDGAPRALRPADLENDDGLAAIRRAVEGGHEALGLAHGLEKEGDDPRGRIVDEELEVVRGREDRLVARRDHVAESEPPAIREKPDAEGAALRDETDVAGEEGGIGEGLDVDEAPRVRADHAHAVGPAQRDPGLPADRHQLLLAPPPLLPALGKAAVEDDGGAHASLGGEADVLEHPRVVHADREHVRRLRQVGHRRVAAPAEERLVLGIDGIDGTGEADTIQALDDHPSG